MNHLKRAMQLAHDRGMKLVQCPADAGLARISCNACGWSHTDEYDVLLERYVLAPHGCNPCQWSVEHGRPCPGPPRPQDRAQ